MWVGGGKAGVGGDGEEETHIVRDVGGEALGETLIRTPQEGGQDRSEHCIGSSRLAAEAAGLCQAPAFIFITAGDSFP